jgi:hypothetical protein
MNEQTKAQIDAKLALYKSQNLPAATAKSLIQGEFGVQVQLDPTEPQASPVRPAGSDLHALTHAVVAGMEIYDARREAIKLESQAAELQAARDTQIDERFDNLERLSRGLVGSHISHLSQHAALDAGEIDSLDPAASLRPFLDVLPKDQAEAALAGLPASFREMLESKPALPAAKPVSDDRTLEAEVKPKRGWFGASR